MFWLWRKDSNLRMAALTVRCLTNLATPQSGGYGWIQTTNPALMRRLLYPLSYTAVCVWKPAGLLKLPTPTHGSGWTIQIFFYTYSTEPFESHQR